MSKLLHILNKMLVPYLTIETKHANIIFCHFSTFYENPYTNILINTKVILLVFLSSYVLNQKLETYCQKSYQDSSLDNKSLCQHEVQSKTIQYTKTEITNLHSLSLKQKFRNIMHTMYFDQNNVCSDNDRLRLDR